MDRAVRDVNVHYEEVGAGRLFLGIHAWLADARSAMSDLEPYFASRPGWRRIYPDAVGIVRTPVPDWLHGPDELLDVLLEFIDAVAPGERFVVAGTSWGAYYAAGMVHHRREQVAGALFEVPLLETGGGGDRPEHRVVRHDPEFAAALRPDEGWITEYLVTQSMDALGSIRDWLWAPPYDPAAEALLSGKKFSFDPMSLSEPCLAPTLVLMGHQDHVLGYQKGWSMIDRFPRGTFAVLDGAGHLLDADRPALRHALIGDWLDRVEQDAAELARP